MYCLSIVTMNRAAILRRTLEAIHQTCPEPHRVFVTDNASQDDTTAMLRQAQAEGLVTDYVSLPENLGTAGGRNAHWEHCLGHDTVRMDDKSLPLAAGWLTAMKAVSDANHAIVGPPYDPTVRPLERLAPCIPFLGWNQDQGRGGPALFIPAEVTERVGAIDELVNEAGGRCVYGWDDVLQIERAILLGWCFGFCLNTPWQFTASASPERRAKAMEWHPLYLQRLREYREAERDVFVDVRDTYGYRVGQEARR